MKVLWFSNTPANSDEYFGSELKGTGSWIKTLDKFLQNKVDLHVAFMHHNDIQFMYNRTCYHAITNKMSFSRKVLRKLFDDHAVQYELRKYLEIIDKVQPDIIHIHGTENSFVDIISYSNIPIVLSVQGNITVIMHKFFSGFEERFLHIKKFDKFSIKDFLFPKSYSQTYSQLKKMRQRELKYFYLVKNIIGRTDWDRRITQVFSPSRNYFHVDEILRESFYQQQWRPHYREKPILISVAGTAFYKGIETICLALNELNKTGVCFEWRIAGIIENDLIVKIIKKKLDVNFPKDGLVFLGNLNEEHLVRSLLDSDIFVLSSHIENSPNSLCEAMMLGLPCISTFVGGTGSIIIDKEDGMLIQDGDPWAMAGVILELVNNKDKAIMIGEKARRNAKNRHDKIKIVDDLVNAYKTIIESHR